MFRHWLTSSVLMMLLATSVSAQLPETQFVAEWTQLDWMFPSAKERTAFEASGAAHKAPPAGVAVGQDGTIYVTVPRWLHKDVPATLNRVVDMDGKPLLEPFPTWSANRLADPAAIQNALGLTIDAHNRMYVLDMGGGVPGIEATRDGAQKLIVIDLATRSILRIYPISDSIAHRSKSFLNGVAVDDVNGFAYLSDSGVKSAPDNQTGIIVVRLSDGVMRRVLVNHPSTKNNPSIPLIAAGEPVFPDQPLQVGINGIAASGDGNWVYWSQTTGKDFHRVPAALLRDLAKSDQEIAAAVQNLGSFGGNSDGIATDSDEMVYITDLTNSRIVRFDPEAMQFSSLMAAPYIVWPDSLALGPDAWLYLTINQLHRAFADKL